MTKIYYITDKATWSSALHLFDQSHWIETEQDGKILVACTFLSETNIDVWESFDGVEPLPHPVLGSTTPIHGNHVVMLSKIGAVNTDTVMDIAKKAGLLHPGLRPSRI